MISFNSNAIRYINVGGKVLGEKHYSAEGTLTKQLRYIFDENGMVCGYLSSTDGATWTQYHFITNLQGDVLHVYRVVDKAIVASYSYDSWGNILSATGELAEENPFRYRGYYYDAETGFYYLNSRYYDSELGRFINADGYTSTGKGILGYNMYTYCSNNPIVHMDYTGEYEVSVLKRDIGMPLAGACCIIIMQPLFTNMIEAIQGLADTVSGITFERTYERAETKEEAKAEAITIPKPENYGTTYYHVTTPANAAIIATSGTMIGSTWEAGYVYAWKMIPSKYAIKHSGANYGVIISFKTNASFSRDTGITDPRVQIYGPVVTNRPGPIDVWDVQIIGVTR